MIIHSEQEMLDFGKSLGSQLLDNRLSPIIELVGDVGAGKTTFVRGLAKGLGIKEPVTSPSFTISKSYALPGNNGYLIHYDFYRLPDPGLMSEDLAEAIMNPNNIVVIEWGESVSSLLPKDHTLIRIEYTETGDRNLFFQQHKMI